MNVRHILVISSGKDSAALAIYLKQKYPSLKIMYYNPLSLAQLPSHYPQEQSEVHRNKYHFEFENGEVLRQKLYEHLKVGVSIKKL